MKNFTPAQSKISPAQKRIARRATMTSALAILLSATAAHADPATDFTLPTNGNVIHGTTTIGPTVTTKFLGFTTATSMTVTQESARTVIEWDTFDIGSKATVTFNQTTGPSAVAVNRVKAGDTAEIYGRLSANGTVVILDQNGVVFGPNAKINVGGLIASTGKISNANAMSGGPLVITDIDGSGKIVNNAAPGLFNLFNKDVGITVKDGGLLAFVAPHVENNGVISAQLGKVSLAAGKKATIDLAGDGLVQIALGDQVGKGLVKNAGSITANGGVIKLTAYAAKGLVDEVVNNTGVLRADTYSSKNGKIILSAGKNPWEGSGKIKLSGTVSATAPSKSIEVSAATIDINGTLRLDYGQLFLYAQTANLSAKVVTDEFLFPSKQYEPRIYGDVRLVNVLNPNASIQQGVAFTGSGGKTKVGNGIYFENVVIPKAMTLEGSGNTVIIGTEDGGSVVTIASRLVTVQDLAINGLGYSNHGISVDNLNKDVDQFTIQNNLIENVKLDGIHVEGPGSSGSWTEGGASPFRMAIVNNTITNAGRDGIHAVNADNLYINHNLVKASLTHDGAKRDGIHVENTFNSEISGNFVLGSDRGNEYGAGRDGIRVENAGFTKIAGNFIGLVEQTEEGGDHPSFLEKFFSFLEGDWWRGGTDLGAKRDGISVDGSYDVSIDTNIVTNYGKDGIQLSRSGLVEIVGNVVDSLRAFARSTGIRLWDNNNGYDGDESPDSGNGDVLVENNTVRNNWTGLDATAFNNEYIALSGNTFEDNFFHAIFGSGEIDLTGDTNTFKDGAVALMFKRAWRNPGEQQKKVSFFDESGPGFGSGYEYAELSLTGNTLGKTVFEGQSYRYVKLLGDALYAPGSPTVIDGTGATYDGVEGGLMTAAERDAIEAMLLDFDDEGTQGQIFAGGPNFNIDNNDVFENVGGTQYLKGKVQVFAGGRPGNGQPPNLADIEPAAGEGTTGNSGGSATTVSCWSNVGASIGGSTPVSLDIGADAASNLSAESECGGESL